MAQRWLNTVVICRQVGRGIGYRRRSVQGLSKTPGAATCKLCRNSTHSRRLDKGSGLVWSGLVSGWGREREEGRIRGRAVLVCCSLATEWHDSRGLCVVMRIGSFVDGGAASLTQAGGRQTDADGTCKDAV